MSLRILNTGKRGKPRRMKTSPNLLLITSIPPAPTYFTADRVVVWQQYANVLIERGDLSEGDLGTLENYVMALCDYRDHTADIAANGYTMTNIQGNTVQRPVCGLRRQSEMQLMVAGAALGLSPRGRASIARAEKGLEEQPEELKQAASF